jgi:hypothetical protein
MSHILRYIFVIAVAYDGRRLSPRRHTLVRVRLPDKLSEHDCLLFISFFTFGFPSIIVLALGTRKPPRVGAVG